MRKNSARKWLHFTLDLLPLIAIPVFMVYAHRHSLTERTNVEVNYKYETNDVNNIDDLIEGNVYSFDLSSDTIDDNEFYDFDCRILSGGINFYDGDFDTFDVQDYVNSDFTFNLYFEGQYSVFTVLNGNNGFVLSFTGTWFETDNLIIQFIAFNEISEGASFSYFSSTTYNEIESVNADTSNENIMNVFYNDFCVATEKYFNFDNVFNFGDIWQWFETNMFGGNAPAIAHAIYEIIVYELIMDIMFLSYAVFMFIIDFAEDTLARFTGWSSRG